MKPPSYFTEGMKPVLFFFFSPQKLHFADFELDGSVVAFGADKARPSAGTNMAALATSTRSAWASHAQLTQAQHALPGATLIPLLVLYRIFPSNSLLLPLILKPELTSFSSSRWLQIVAQIPAGEVWQAQMALPASLAAVFVYFFSKPLK